MLAWRHAAFSHGVAVAGYRDQAEGVITQLPAGRSWVSEGRGAGTRTATIRDKNLAALGIPDLRSDLIGITNMKVGIMIYHSAETVVNRSPSVAIPKVSR